MKRTPLARGAPLRRTRWEPKRKALPPRSAKRQAESPERAAFVAALLRVFPDCQIGAILRWHSHPAASRCDGQAIEVHETLKRSRGGSILNRHNCLTTCRPCHRFTEEEPAEATFLGLLVPSWSPEAEELRR